MVKLTMYWFILDFARFWWQYTVPSMGSLYWENGWNIDSRGPYCYCRCRSILSRHGIQLRSCGSQPCAVTVQNIPKHSNKERNSFGWDTHLHILGNKGLELIPTSPVNGCRFFLSRTEIRSWLAQHIRAARAGCQWKYVKTNVNLSIMEIDRCQIP